MINFHDWLKIKESSPATRNKWAAALGLQPMYSADVYGHATPPAWQAERLTKKLSGKKRKKHKKHKKHKKS